MVAPLSRALPHLLALAALAASPGVFLLAQASDLQADIAARSVAASSGEEVAPDAAFARRLTTCKFNETVNCPGSDATCKGNQCCPRGPGAATTLPCPSAHPDFTDCEGSAKQLDCLDPSVAEEMSETTKVTTRTTTKTTTTKTSTKTTTTLRATTTKPTTSRRSTRGSYHYDVTTTTGFFFHYDYDSSGACVVAPTLLSVLAAAGIACLQQ